MGKPKGQTLSVGETARRLDVSPDSVRNYCERGWLQFIRVRGNHRRIFVSSIESFEAARRSNQVVQAPEKPAERRTIEEDWEFYYLGNNECPNDLVRGYICNASFFGNTAGGPIKSSSIMMHIGSIFGGGTFRVVRVRDGEVVSERTVVLPGPTKEDVAIMREVALDD